MKKQIDPNGMTFAAFTKYECHENYSGQCSIVNEFKIDFTNQKPKSGEHEADYCQELYLGMLIGNHIDNYDFDFVKEWYEDAGVDEQFYFAMIMTKVSTQEYKTYLSGAKNEAINKISKVASHLRNEIQSLINVYLQNGLINPDNFNKLINLGIMQSKYANESTLPRIDAENRQLVDGRHRTCVGTRRDFKYVWYSD